MEAWPQNLYNLSLFYYSIISFSMIFDTLFFELQYGGTASHKHLTHFFTLLHSPICEPLTLVEFWDLAPTAFLDFANHFLLDFCNL